MKISKMLCPLLSLLLFLNMSPAVMAQEMEDPQLGSDGIALEAAPVTQFPNELAVFQFLRNEMGLNIAACSGIMANLQDESGFDPNNYYANDYGGTSNYGIVQWNSGYTGGRQALLRTWCAQNGLDYRTLDGQLRFMRHELETVPSYQYEAIRSVPETAYGASQAALLVAMHYEGVVASRYGVRQQLAAGHYFPHYINQDFQAPSLMITGLEVNRSGCLVTMQASDDRGMDRVQLAVWTEKNGQDDLKADWQTNASCKAQDLGGGRYQYQINKADHNNELGLYNIHVYAFDTGGNVTAMPAGPVEIVEIHDYTGKQEVVTEATCTDAGLKRVHCVDNCGSYVESEIPAKGHDYSEWNELSGIGKDGKEKRTCSRCDLEEVREIPEYLVLTRLYNPNSGEHFYTEEPQEIAYLIKAGWKEEGKAWNAPYKTGEPVYRLYNPNAGDHHYTLDAKERDGLVRLGWKSEGIGWNSADETGVPIYRQYNPNAAAGSHNFTADEKEHQGLISLGWNDENIAWYGVAGK